MIMFLDKAEKIERYNQIIKFRDINKLTFEKIGKHYGFSRQRAYQIYVVAKKIKNKKQS